MQILIPRISDVTTRKDLREFMPDDAATRLIRKLNGADLGGKRVDVTRFDKSMSRSVVGA